MLEKTRQSPLDSKEMTPINPRGNQSWIFIGSTDAKVEALIRWPPNAKRQLVGKDPDAGKDWGQEEKGVTEEEMFGWHHWVTGHKSEQTRRQWKTGKPGVLQSMGSQRVGHNLVTEQQQQPIILSFIECFLWLHIKSFRFTRNTAFSWFSWDGEFN